MAKNNYVLVNRTGQKVSGVFMGMTVTGRKTKPRVVFSSPTREPLYFTTQSSAETALKHIKAYGVGKGLSTKSLLA